MSFRLAPIVEDPVDELAGQDLANLQEYPREQFDGFHWLPLLSGCRERISRLGNPLNKRIFRACAAIVSSQHWERLTFNQWGVDEFWELGAISRFVNLEQQSDFSRRSEQGAL
jgi:hypothetical protein